ncbi:MerR family transcriptional regulator [Breznakiella homolactica]|uniref:MerR family transcriptional regulator n=1 Tax=Breznakiella homolactica TaxID=2798577 RepID=A0A7T7XQC9_9SPIR|nr:MerR family transcriptional regulator [Breznakiella homolactica]QQO10541.1 MerR family transcriptional regulator [Breznakiella homolactica]
MASYSIGDVERLVGAKVHVIRYWEKEIPLIQPRKDGFGRRTYSSRDVRILLRLKHLLHVRRFTLEGAREQLLREMSGQDQNIRAEIEALRSSLMDLFFLIRKSAESLEEPAVMQKTRTSDD